MHVPRGGLRSRLVQRELEVSSGVVCKGKCLNEGWKGVLHSIGLDRYAVTLRGVGCAAVRKLPGIRAIHPNVQHISPYA